MMKVVSSNPDTPIDNVVMTSLFRHKMSAVKTRQAKIIKQFKYNLKQNKHR